MFRPRKSRTSERGYGSRHQRVRSGYAQAMAGGYVFLCTVCRKIVDPTEPWDLDHTDDRTGYLGPAHRHCNRRKAALKVNGRHRRRSRRW